MVDLTIRTISADEWPDWVRAAELPFGNHARDEDIEAGRAREVTELDRSFAVFDGDRIVGTSSIHSFELTVPGRLSLPAAGVTAVGVHPTHRRRGLLTHLMRLLLDQARERAEPLAVLYASESLIYGRFGYGVATFDGWCSIDRTRAALGRGPAGEGRLRMVGKDEAIDLAAEPYERVRLEGPGTLRRSRAWWEHRLWDPEPEREGFTAYFFCVYEAQGRTDGYVVYRIKSDWTGGIPAHTLSVDELVATTDDAYLALWQFCFDVDLVATIEARLRPYDEPLRHLLPDPRRLRTTAVTDGLWVRLVDLPVALAGRRYASADRLVIEVRDSFCPGNEGRWLLDGGPDGAECRPADPAAEPDLVCDTVALGSAYLGGVRLATLARAGRVDERVPGALARADAMFGHDPLPMGNTLF